MEEEISKKIRQYRQEKKLTLKELSEKTNLSKSFLSQVERGSTSIAITSLKKIADAFNLPIICFFEDFSNRSYQVKVDEQKPFRTKGSGAIHIRLSGDFLGRTIEPLLLTFPPGEPKENTTNHPGEEYYYVLKGIMVVEVDGKEYIIKEGESIHFPSDISHKISNPHNEDAKVICFVTPIIFY